MNTNRTTLAPRPNKFAARCASCGQTVDAGAGTLTGRPGAWVVAHVAPCPEPVAVLAEEAFAPEPVASPLAALTPGWRYAVETGEGTDGQPVRFFRVSKVRRNGSVYVDQEVGPNTLDAAVVRADGSVFYRDSRVAPYLAAVAADPHAAALLWSAHKGACYKCALALTDWVSRALSEGPVCDSRSAAERKALALAAGATPDPE